MSVKKSSNGNVITDDVIDGLNRLIQDLYSEHPHPLTYDVIRSHPDLESCRNSLIDEYFSVVTEIEQDKKLIEKLKGELSGILTWAVKGCLDWQREELQTPDDVKAATNDYRNEMDEIGIFLTDCCILSPNARTNPTNLYDAYKKWCEDTGETVLSQRAFGTRLTERGLKPKQSGGQRYRSGVGLLEKRTACTA